MSYEFLDVDLDVDLAQIGSQHLGQRLKTHHSSLFTLH